MYLAGVRYYEDSFSQMNGFTSTFTKQNMLPGCFISCCKNIFPAYHHRLSWCSLCLHIQMFPCCTKMLSRKAALLILGQSLVRLRKPQRFLFSASLPTQVHCSFASLPAPWFPWRPAQSYEHSFVCSQCFFFLAIFATACPSLENSFGELEGFL